MLVMYIFRLNLYHEHLSYNSSLYVAERVSNTSNVRTEDMFQCDVCGRRFHTKDKCTIENCTYKVKKTKSHKMKQHIDREHPPQTTTTMPTATTTLTTTTAITPTKKTTTAFQTPTKTATTTLPCTPTMLNQPAVMWKSPELDLGEFFEFNTSTMSADFEEFLQGIKPLDMSMKTSSPKKTTKLQQETVTTTMTQATTVGHHQETQTSAELQHQQTQTVTGPLEDRTTQTTCIPTEQHHQQTQTVTGPWEDRTTQTSCLSTEQTTQTDSPAHDQTHQTTQTDLETSRPFKPEHFSSDPECFFAGAPSSYMDGETATYLKGARKTALQQREAYKRRWVPDGYLCISKKETAVLPDGTVYTLEDVWVRQPKRTKATSQQTQTETTDEDLTRPQEVPLDLRVRIEE